MRVIVHVPASRLLVEGDLTTQNWDYNWWGDSVMNNIDYRKIKVDTHLAVHGQKPLPLAEVVSAIERQVRNTQAFCRRAAEAQFFQPGCPMQYNRPLPPRIELIDRADAAPLVNTVRLIAAAFVDVDVDVGVMLLRYHDCRLIRRKPSV